MFKEKKSRAKSARMKTPATKPAPVKAQSASGEVKASAGVKPKNNAAQAVRPTTPTSASEGLLSLIRLNFGALREQVKNAMEEAQRERATSGKAGEAFITALNQLEAGYEELLRGHEDGHRR